MTRANAVFLLLFFGCLFSCKQQVDSEKPRTIILVSIDTLRSDHLPVYGYDGVETPHIDEFRKDAILFEHAYSHSPLTLPSHASILTGRMPSDHGIRDNVGFSLRADVPTLAERLGAYGFATGAAVSAYVLRRETGLARGFDWYEDSMEGSESDQALGRIQRSGRLTLSAAESWLSKQRKPAFLFVHLYEPHSPYEPPERFARYPSAYDGEIALVDELFGDFVKRLKQLGAYDNALIILLSDHGEGLNDHGEEEHGIFLYRESIQVPLLIKLPSSRLRGKTVAETVGLSDIFPTVLAAAGSTDPDERKNSLLNRSSPARVGKQVHSETLYPRFHFGWSELHSVIAGNEHYIHAPRPELYDLYQDPGEKLNVVDDRRRRYTALRHAAERQLRASPASSAIDPEIAAKLAALGYLGGGGGEIPSDVTLPDPKEGIGTFPLIKTAFTLFRDEKYEQSIPVLARLRALHPRMPDAWYMSARAAAKLGREREAAGTLAQGLRILPGNTKLATEAANIYIDLKELDLARRHAELAVRGDPAQAHEILARVALAEGDLPRAVDECKLSLESKPDRPLTFLTMGRIEQARGDAAKALQYFDRVAESVRTGKQPSLPLLHLWRGDSLGRLHRYTEAEAAYREEIRLFPDDGRAYTNLVLLYLSTGRSSEATKTVYALIQSVPRAESYVAVASIMQRVGDRSGYRYWVGQGLGHFPDNPQLRRLGRSL